MGGHPQIPRQNQGQLQFPLRSEAGVVRSGGLSNHFCDIFGNLDSPLYGIFFKQGNLPLQMGGNCLLESPPSCIMDSWDSVSTAALRPSESSRDWPGSSWVCRTPSPCSMMTRPDRGRGRVFFFFWGGRGFGAGGGGGGNITLLAERLRGWAGFQLGSLH